MKLCPNIEICFICDKEEQTSSWDNTVDAFSVLISFSTCHDKLATFVLNQDVSTCSEFSSSAILIVT